MSKITELRKKRADLWEQAKKFLDSAKRDNNGLLTAKDVEEYEKMEADIVAIKKEIDILERQEAIDKEMAAPTTEPVKNTPKPASDTKTGRASDAYKAAFWDVMRNKFSFAAKDALQIGTDSEGGFLVPDEFERQLIDKLHDENIIRGYATIITTESGDRKIPVVASHGAAAWTDEEAEYTESDDAFGVVTLGAHKLATIIKVSEELLNDSAFNLETYIASEFVRRMATAEEDAFINGNGTGKPTGLLTTGETGITAASTTAITADEVIDLYHSLRTPYRKNAQFIANDSTVKAIRKLKDNTGQYVWQPGLQAGQPDTILNRPILTSQHMPEIGAGRKILLFGDLSYYWIADRQGRTFQRLSELYAKTGQVGFRVFQRLDGKLILPEAVKTLQMKAS
ncbi:MAG: phage major capsid protein [Clostridia bacterium]|nr:phage major capsid protein [Clostridia bacterium]